MSGVPKAMKYLVQIGYQIIKFSLMAKFHTQQPQHIHDMLHKLEGVIERGTHTQSKVDMYTHQECRQQHSFHQVTIAYYSYTPPISANLAIISVYARSHCTIIMVILVTLWGTTTCGLAHNLYGYGGMLAQMLWDSGAFSGTNLTLLQQCFIVATMQ